MVYEGNIFLPSTLFAGNHMANPYIKSMALKYLHHLFSISSGYVRVLLQRLWHS